MNLRIGSQVMRDVQIPVLWGSRAIVQDQQGRLSVIDLSSSQARLEILGDKPAPGTEFRPGVEGFTVLADGEILYSYDPVSKVLQGIGIDLPECEISRSRIRVGGIELVNNVIVGAKVGVLVNETGIGIGAPAPAALAKLIV